MAECHDVVGCEGSDLGSGFCRAVLAHGSYDDPVFESGAADLEGLEQCRHGLGGIEGCAWRSLVVWREVWEAWYWGIAMGGEVGFG